MKKNSAIPRSTALFGLALSWLVLAFAPVSLVADVKILVRTVGVVVKATGC